MKTLIALTLASILAGCVTDQEQRPVPVQVDISGPMFAASDFNCGKDPLPPEPLSLDPAHQGSAAATYEKKLDTWGNGCNNKLHSVGQQLDAAGQIKH